MELLKLLDGKGADEKEMIIRNHADTLTDLVPYKLPLSDQEVKDAQARHANLDLALEDAEDEYKRIKEEPMAKIKDLKAALLQNRKVVRSKSIDAKGIIATVVDTEAKQLYEMTLQGRIISQRPLRKHETQQLSATRIEAGGELQTV